MNRIHKRIIEISKKHNLSHLGSCLTAANIINDIYLRKKEDEPFILSSGHAGLALYVILEKFYNLDAEQLYLKHGTHPNRDLDNKIYCSTGSLGMGLSIACGMALADRSKNVYCLISDGESYEGVIWEASNLIKDQNITNLKLYCNFNGFGAYDAIDQKHKIMLKQLFPDMKVIETNVEDYGLKGLSAHYIKAEQI